MSTSYGGTPTGITGTHYGGAGLGVRGDAVPADGESGAGYLYAGLSLPADAAKEVRGPITRWPAGTLTVYEDSSFTYDGATDYALYALYVDGVASTDDIGYGAGIGRFDLVVGGGLDGGVTLEDATTGGSLASAISLLGGGVTLDESPASGELSIPTSHMDGGVTLAGTSAAGGLTSGTGTGTGTTAAEIWSYVLSNGKTAEQAVVESHAMLTALLSGIASLPADVRAELESTAIPVNVKRVNDVVLQGTGVPGDSMRPA